MQGFEKQIANSNMDMLNGYEEKKMFGEFCELDEILMDDEISQEELSEEELLEEARELQISQQQGDWLDGYLEAMEEWEDDENEW